MANIVPVLKKDGKVRICVDYRDLNRASPNDNFPLRHIDILLDLNRAILEMSEPRTEKQVRGFLGRLNYIARFISQLTPTCAPIFKLLRKNQAVLWNSDCPEAF